MYVVFLSCSHNIYFPVSLPLANTHVFSCELVILVYMYYNTYIDSQHTLLAMYILLPRWLSASSFATFPTDKKAFSDDWCLLLIIYSIWAEGVIRLLWRQWYLLFTPVTRNPHRDMGECCRINMREQWAHEKSIMSITQACKDTRAKQTWTCMVCQLSLACCGTTYWYTACNILHVYPQIHIVHMYTI